MAQLIHTGGAPQPSPTRPTCSYPALEARVTRERRAPWVALCALDPLVQPLQRWAYRMRASAAQTAAGPHRSPTRQRGHLAAQLRCPARPVGAGASPVGGALPPAPSPSPPTLPLPLPPACARLQAGDLSYGCVALLALSAATLEVLVGDRGLLVDRLDLPLLAYLRVRAAGGVPQRYCTPIPLEAAGQGAQRRAPVRPVPCSMCWWRSTRCCCPRG
jgi:hypothetical protein